MANEHECDLCGETFDSEEDLEEHLKDYHGGD